MGGNKLIFHRESRENMKTCLLAVVDFEARRRLCCGSAGNPHSSFAFEVTPCEMDRFCRQTSKSSRSTR